MKAVKKFLLLFFIICLVIGLIFLCFGSFVEPLFSMEKTSRLFQDFKAAGWIVGILLLVSDILLPIPATGIMAALGNVYGIIPGALTAAAGSMLSGLIGYLAARILDRKFHQYIATDAEMKALKTFFDAWGGYGVAVSRTLPIMPEAISLMAGLAKMNFPKFMLALAVGTVPTAFFFAAVGAKTALFPGAGILVSMLIPVCLWPPLAKLIKN